MKSSPARNPTSGAALVIVLGVLVLLLGLIVAFITRAGSERTSSSSYAASNSSRNLADLAVNLVQGQINNASSKGATKAWVSQPGAISVFSGNGSLDNLYRLYSAASLTTTSAADIANDLPPSDWATGPALWCDLNAPAVIPSGNSTQTIWPILDPTNVGTSASPNPTAPQGLAIDSAPGATTDQPAPMPVRWLYVLKDGTLATPGNGTTEVTVPGASDTNPITGRIAFWTDDDTCRVNVNTASEGTFWDVPRAYNNQEQNYAGFQPVKNEFQRYPGHPSMTSLSAVFPSLSRDQIYSLVPRVIGGGSNAGTVRATAALSPDSDRLYASVGELLFTANRTAGPLTKPDLERAKFTLTAQSRAPEINLFNLPRVAIWPEDTDADKRTPIDLLIARAATINGQPYYFQRNNPKSATSDYSTIARNQDLYSYLQNLTSQPFPGFGSTSLETKYGTDRDQILTEMFDYIRCTNLDDGQLSEGNRFSVRGELTPTANGATDPGFGQVTPIRIGSTQGFGRFPALSEFGLQFIATADGAGFKISGNKPTKAQCANDQLIANANDAKIDSNVAANRTLGGTLLKGESFLDIGYGPSATGKGNKAFDWADSTTTAYGATWQGNGFCDFEPWNDSNQNGLFESGEPFYDANGNGAYDQEAHEPLHDWGRTSTAAPGWVNGPPSKPAASWPDPPAAPTAVATWPPAASNVNTSQNGRYDPAQRRIEAVFFVSFFTAGQAWPPLNGPYTLRVRGLDSFQINGQGLGFPSDGSARSNWEPGGLFHSRRWGGLASHRSFLADRRLPARGVMPADTNGGVERPFPFVSIPFTVEVPATRTMSFTGGTITIELYPKDLSVTSGYSGAPVQTYSVEFPSATFPIPDLVADAVDSSGNTIMDPDTGKPASTPKKPGTWPAAATQKENWWTFSRDGWKGDGTLGRLAAEMLNADPGYGNITNGQYRGTPFRNEDVVRTIVPSTGDPRISSALASVPSSQFVPHPKYNDTSTKVAHSIPEGIGSHYFVGFSADPGGYAGSGVSYYLRVQPAIAIANPNSYNYGDWDNGVANCMDGPYINRADEGNAKNLSDPAKVPYFNDNEQYENIGSARFSPNRQIPSAGMFGSLPSAVKAGTGFRTLLFRPQSGHPGANAPADHLWMDLFWMPVVEPYAISEPFSTAGKINMNTAIAPFSYITRQTGLYALLKAEKVMAIPNGSASNYKDGAGATEFRKAINIPETLKQFDAKFTAASGPRVFLSPTQICELHLVPDGTSLSGMSTFWDSYKLTGDNSRERPYTNLVGRLTTKSNSYTVYYTVQALANPPSADQTKWNEDKGRVLSEYRGSTSLERYLDPEDPNIPDYAASSDPTNEDTLDKFYRWRVTGTRQFAP